MHISVALCTYNGARYLPAQLASLAAQRRPPDELVVCDDRSSDDTPAILAQFAATASFPVRWSINPVNLGSTRNFDRAIELCRGELIALCDQDDVWFPDKLAVMERVFLQRPEVALSASDADLIGREGQSLGRTLWASVGFTESERAAILQGKGAGILLGKTCLTGATLVFRRALADLARPFAPGWVHDAWLTFFAVASAQIHLIPDRLIGYRLHPNQQIGLGQAPDGRSDSRPLLADIRRLSPGYFHRLAAEYSVLGHRLTAIRAHLRDRWLPARVRAKASHFTARGRIRETDRLHRVPRVLREALALRYSRFGLGPLGVYSLAADLIF